MPKAEDKPDWETGTAGQSLMILRPDSREHPIHPEVLFMFLSAPAVLRYWQTIAAGNRSKALSINDIANLRIPLPSDELQIEVRGMFEKIARIGRWRRALATKNRSLREHAWAAFSRDEVEQRRT